MPTGACWTGAEHAGQPGAGPGVELGSPWGWASAWQGDGLPSPSFSGQTRGLGLGHRAGCEPGVGH